MELNSFGSLVVEVARVTGRNVLAFVSRLFPASTTRATLSKCTLNSIDQSSPEFVRVKRENATASHLVLGPNSQEIKA